MNKFSLRSVSFLITVLGVLFSGVSSAEDLFEGEYYIVAKHSYKALTVLDDRKGHLVLGQTARRAGSDNSQLWRIHKQSGQAGTSEYTIRSSKYNLYLSGGGENENGDTSAVLLPEKTSWWLEAYHNSYGIELKNTGQTLNVTGGEMADRALIIVYDASIEENAQWLLFPAGKVLEATIALEQPSYFDNLAKTYRIFPLPAASREAERLRQMKLMDYQPAGLYVKKGEPVSVTVQGLSSSPDRLVIMIGPMNSFEEDKTHNNPQVIYAAEGRTNFIASRSGLVYFRYTDSGYNISALSSVGVKFIKGGSPVPFYRDGKTSHADWTAMLAQYPDAPFVEILSDHTLVTASRKVYNKEMLHDPHQILVLLEQIVTGYNQLSGLDGSSDLHKPSSLRVHYQEDTVTPSDVLGEIYMYASDYFIGVPSANMSDLLNPVKLKHAWSIWHETGHKYQQSDWTWDDVVEVTVNIYSLNAQRHFGYASRLKERDPYTGKNPLQLAAKYLSRKKRDFTNPKHMRLGVDDDSENWVRLVMFDQLQQGYGTGFYPAMHKYYREHPLGDVDDLFKAQEFVLRAAFVAKQDLSVFFTDWGVSVSQSVTDRLRRKNLPYADISLSHIAVGD